jgi:hypothetical protein
MLALILLTAEEIPQEAGVFSRRPSAGPGTRESFCPDAPPAPKKKSLRRSSQESRISLEFECKAEAVRCRFLEALEDEHGLEPLVELEIGASGENDFLHAAVAEFSERPLDIASPALEIGKIHPRPWKRQLTIQRRIRKCQKLYFPQNLISLRNVAWKKQIAREKRLLPPN